MIEQQGITQQFLTLITYTTPFGEEGTLRDLLPENILQDEVGNYYRQIGNSKTMFCAHLDTFCNKLEKTQYSTDGNTVKAVGKTTLGADDKAGVLVLLRMMEHKVPGLYYFFIGEEPGRMGSKGAMALYPEVFGSMERCIAFDRFGTHSLITHQHGLQTCSDAFADNLMHVLNRNDGLEFQKDNTGLSCDSFSFTALIPQCTNLSVGYRNQHTCYEEQDIHFLTLLINACLSIQWEKLTGNGNQQSKAA